MTVQESRFAILMDGGAVYFAVRDLYEGLQLEYPELARILCRKYPTELRPPDPRTRANPDQLWAMWTSFHSQNIGQARFLDYAEQTLGWNVRRFAPSDSYTIDPQTTLGLSKSSDGGSSRVVNRLIRFDASIAYTIGRIAKTHKIVLISDSYSLAEPLVRAAGLRSGKNCVVFFGRLLDPRWLGLRKSASDFLDFIDLDEESEALFGARPVASSATWMDSFPIQ